MHQEEVNFLDVADEELLEAVGEKVTGLLVAPVTNLGHGELSLEPTPHSVVNTLGFPPCFLDAVVTVGLVALEMLGALLDDGDLDGHGGPRVLDFGNDGLLVH